MKLTRALSLPLLALPLIVAGCRVQTNDHGDGKKDVDVATPFGGMHVKTSDDLGPSDLGASIYPGAQKYTEKKNEKDANVDMHFANFHLKVKVARFITPDDRDKVLAFYQNDLKRYGDVLLCQKDKPVENSKVSTAQGLTCNDDDKDAHTKVVHLQDANGTLELKAGSKKHQHVIEVEKNTSGTQFSIVELQLPGEGEAD